MIVRRIRMHVARQDWFAVLIDLLIAILGVFIGIQVANWNEARGQRAQSHEDRQRLIADLDSNAADNENRALYFGAVRRHALGALAALERPAVESGEAFLIDAYQATQLVPRAFKHTTYDEIVATGRLTRLAEPVLRDHVGNLYSTAEAARPLFNFVPPYRELLRRAMPSAAQAAVRQRCSETYSFLADGTPLMALPERCTLGLDPALVAASVRAVRAIPEVRGELDRVVADNDSKIFALGMHLRQVRELRARLVAADAR